MVVVPAKNKTIEDAWKSKFKLPTYLVIRDRSTLEAEGRVV